MESIFSNSGMKCMLDQKILLILILIKLNVCDWEIFWHPESELVMIQA